MSSSPASTVLATPTYSRSGRERKIVQKYGSMIDSDIISDPDDEAYGYYDPDDEDESFDEARVKDSDDEDEDGDGEEGDDEITVSGLTTQFRCWMLQCGERVTDMTARYRCRNPSRRSRVSQRRRSLTPPRPPPTSRSLPGCFFPSQPRPSRRRKGFPSQALPPAR
jgi:hypothetical protein